MHLWDEVFILFYSFTVIVSAYHFLSTCDFLIVDFLPALSIASHVGITVPHFLQTLPCSSGLGSGLRPEDVASLQEGVATLVSFSFILPCYLCLVPV